MDSTNPDQMRDAMLRAVDHRVSTDAFDFDAGLKAMLAPLGLSPDACGGNIRFDRLDPLIHSQVRLGAASALALVQQAVVAAHIWRMRTGQGQDISVDLGQAVQRLSPAAAFRWEMLNGIPADLSDRSIGALISPQRTKDGRHVVPNNLYPGIRARMLSALDCADNPSAIKRAIASHTAEELEQMAEAEGFVMAKVRSVHEFVHEPVFDHLAYQPLIQIEKVEDSEPEPFDALSIAPLSGIRALGMGHLVAGPAIGRSLAAHGADVLQVYRGTAWEQEALLFAPHIGSRSCRLELDSYEGRQQLYTLLRSADVFFTNWAPNELTAQGLDEGSAFAQRAGLVYVNATIHGEQGPWANRIGFDHPAGAVTGLMAAEGSLFDPRLPLVTIVTGYLLAWLGATGAMVALARRAREGGSYKVHVSLSRAAMWIITLGMFDPGFVAETVGQKTSHHLPAPQLFRATTPLGLYQGITESVNLSRTPHHYTNVLSPRGADLAQWLSKPRAQDLQRLKALIE